MKCYVIAVSACRRVVQVDSCVVWLLTSTAAAAASCALMCIAHTAISNCLEPCGLRG